MGDACSVKGSREERHGRYNRPHGQSGRRLKRAKEQLKDGECPSHRPEPRRWPRRCTVHRLVADDELPRLRVLRTVEINALVENRGGGVITVGEVVVKLRCSSLRQCAGLGATGRRDRRSTTQGPMREVMLVQDRL